MSQADATSLEGDQPATTGCYKQYDHAIADRISQHVDLSQMSPTKDRRFSIDDQVSPEKRLLINPDTTDDKKMADKQLDLDQLPSEFECCFCTFKGYKDFIDAEQLMPIATSDLRNPVCVELACLQRHPAPRAQPEATPNSLDSPDFASCITHPFPSEGEIDSSNLYVNPLDGGGAHASNTIAIPSEYNGVRRSASGDGTIFPKDSQSDALQGSRCTLGGVPVRALDASRTSLPQPLEPVGVLTFEDSKPKHRKARFQQDWPEEEKRPPRGIATRIINHHILFGKNGNKRDNESRSRSILKNKESRGTDSELLIQETTSLGANGDSGSECSPIRLKNFKGQNHKNGGSEKDNFVN